jgi:hypothetical protein
VPFEDRLLTGRDRPARRQCLQSAGAEIQATAKAYQRELENAANAAVGRMFTVEREAIEEAKANVRRCGPDGSGARRARTNPCPDYLPAPRAIGLAQHGVAAVAILLPSARR